MRQTETGTLRRFGWSTLVTAAFAIIIVAAVVLLTACSDERDGQVTAENQREQGAMRALTPETAQERALRDAAEGRADPAGVNERARAESTAQSPSQSSSQASPQSTGERSATGTEDGPERASGQLTGVSAGRLPEKFSDIRFHDFDLKGERSNGELVLSYQGRELSSNAGGLAEIETSDTVSNFPRNGCETMKVDLFTGGANCCSGYYLLSSCGDNGYAAYIEPYAGTLSERPATVEGNIRGYLADDPAFMYYQPEAPGGDALSFDRPGSPRLRRFIVFENGSWRADRVGEFQPAYEKLLEQARADKSMNPSARAISIAYYSLMSGRPVTSAAVGLRADLPSAQAGLAPAIMRDVEKAVSGFAPVRNLSVRR